MVLSTKGLIEGVAPAAGSPGREAPPAPVPIEIPTDAPDPPDGSDKNPPGAASGKAVDSGTVPDPVPLPDPLSPATAPESPPTAAAEPSATVAPEPPPATGAGTVPAATVPPPAVVVVCPPAGTAPATVATGTPVPATVAAGTAVPETAVLVAVGVSGVTDSLIKVAAPVAGLIVVDSGAPWFALSAATIA